MSALRVLVADDEPLARQVLIDLLRRDADVGEIEECRSGQDAIDAARARPFDVAFIDVEMPVVTGFDVITTPGLSIGAIVFVTAFGEYAVRAFDADAADYLLKPFSDARFAEAFERAKRRLRSASPVSPGAGALGAHDSQRFLQRVAFKEGDTSLVIPVQDIVWLEAQDYYVRLHLADKRHLVRATLSDFERRLDPTRFVRVHRGAIVNIARVTSVVERDGMELVLRDGTTLAVSRARRAGVRKALLPSVRR